MAYTVEVSLPFAHWTIDDDYATFAPPPGSYVNLGFSVNANPFVRIYLSQLSIPLAGGVAAVRLADSQQLDVRIGPEFSELFEQQGSWIFGGPTLFSDDFSETWSPQVLFGGTGLDRTEPYVWQPDRATNIAAVARYFRRLSEEATFAVTLRLTDDYTYAVGHVTTNVQPTEPTVASVADQFERYGAPVRIQLPQPSVIPSQQPYSYRVENLPIGLVFEDDSPTGPLISGSTLVSGEHELVYVVTSIGYAATRRPFVLTIGDPPNTAGVFYDMDLYKGQPTAVWDTTQPDDQIPHLIAEWDLTFGFDTERGTASPTVPHFSATVIDLDEDGPPCEVGDRLVAQVQVGAADPVRIFTGIIQAVRPEVRLTVHRYRIMAYGLQYRISNNDVPFDAPQFNVGGLVKAGLIESGVPEANVIIGGGMTGNIGGQSFTEGLRSLMRRVQLSAGTDIRWYSDGYGRVIAFNDLRLGDKLSLGLPGGYAATGGTTKERQNDRAIINYIAWPSSVYVPRATGDEVQSGIWEYELTHDIVLLPPPPGSRVVRHLAPDLFVLPEWDRFEDEESVQWQRAPGSRQVGGYGADTSGGEYSLPPPDRWWRDGLPPRQLGRAFFSYISHPSEGNLLTLVNTDDVWWIRGEGTFTRRFYKQRTTPVRTAGPIVGNSSPDSIARFGRRELTQEPVQGLPVSETQDIVDALVRQYASPLWQSTITLDVRSEELRDIIGDGQPFTGFYLGRSADIALADGSTGFGRISRVKMRGARARVTAEVTVEEWRPPPDDDE